MKTPRILIVLTILNLGLVSCQLLPARRAVAADGAAPVLRGRALEIVDDRGKVRASIQVLPPDRSGLLVNGKPPAETVILRLIDPNGKPTVKVAASVNGGGLSMTGEADDIHVILGAGAESSLKLRNKDHEQIIKQ